MKLGKKSKEVAILAVMLLVIVQASAYVDLISPNDNFIINTGDVDYDYYPDLTGGVAECSLEVNGNVLVINTNVINSGINTFATTNTPEGDYDWSVFCSGPNGSETSSTRSLTIDLTNPVVVLTNPLDDAIVESSFNVEFTVTDNKDTELDCEVLLDDQSVAQESVTSIGNILIEGVNPGFHELLVSCEDDAGNTGESAEINIESQEAISFSIALNKQEFNMGETAQLLIDAPDNSNLTLEICPDGTGFVECYAAITLTSAEFPRTETIPYTTSSGDYIIDAYFAYEDVREVRRLTYSVINSFQIYVDGDKEGKTGVNIVLEADASGGIGHLDYEWRLEDGSKISGPIFQKSYGTAGTYNEKIVVTDEANNEYIEVVPITIIKSHPVTVTVRNKLNNQVLDGVVVELDNEQKSTDISGKTTFRSRVGTLDIYAFLTNYELYESDITVDGTENIEIKLIPKTAGFSVTAISPNTGDSLAPGILNFQFNVQNPINSVCKLYIKENGVLHEKASATVSDTNTKQFQYNLAAGNYAWKILCEQGSQSYETAERAFTVQESTPEPAATQQTTTQSDWDKSSMESTLNQVLENYAKMSARERTLAEKLGFSKQVKDALKAVQRTSRDVYDLQYKIGITPEEIEVEKTKLLNNLESTYKNTVKQITVKDSKSYVKYPTKEEFEEIAKSYSIAENIPEESLKSAAQLIESLQGNIVVSTRTSILELEKIDGSKETITVVTKEIKSEGTTSDHYLLEIISKDFAEHASDIIVIGDYEVIEEDPVLKFKVKDEITYYTKKGVSLDKVKQGSTVLGKDLKAGDLQTVTGSAILFVPGEFNGKVLLFLIVILLTGVYLMMGTDVVDKVMSILPHKSNDKEIHYVRVLVNDALDNIKAGNFDKASLIYSDIKITYETMDADSQEKVHSDILNLVNRLDIDYSRQLAHSIDLALKADDWNTAKELYMKLQGTYRKLDPVYKQEIYEKVMAITKRMQG